MDNPLHVSAFDALIDRGVDPGGINDGTIQDEVRTMNSTQVLEAGDSSDLALLDTWRSEKLSELFYHVEFMVERLRTLVDSGAFDDEDPETRETVYRLNLSAKSIQHLSNRSDAAILRDKSE